MASYSGEVAQSEDAQQTGLAAGSIADDDQFPARDLASAAGLAGEPNWYCRATPANNISCTAGIWHNDVLSSLPVGGAPSVRLCWRSLA